MISDVDLKEIMTSKLGFTEMDTRKNMQSLQGAKLSYTDFLAAMACSNQIALNDTLLQATFAKFNTNDSGYISSHDASGMLGNTFAGDVAGELVQATEREDGRVYYPEFVNCIRKYNSDVLITAGPAQLVEQPLPNLLLGQAVVRDRGVEHLGQSLDKSTVGKCEERVPATNVNESPVCRDCRSNVSDAGFQVSACVTSGCRRTSWNGMPGQTCCRTCAFTNGGVHGPDCNRKYGGSIRTI